MPGPFVTASPLGPAAIREEPTGSSGAGSAAGTWFGYGRAVRRCGAGEELGGGS